MKQFLLLTTMVCWLTPAIARADRIYSFVNYPALQDGHTLSGTITTTDDAPDDALLEEDEILEWQWEISGPNNLSVVLIPESSTIVDGIHISIEEITLPLDSDAQLVFFPRNQGVPVWQLAWDANPIASGLPSTYRVGFGLRDSFIPYWESDLPSGDASTWAIATIVPEPSSALLAAPCLFGCITPTLWSFRARNLAIG